MRNRSLMHLSAAVLVAAALCGCANNKAAKVEAPAAGAMTMANTKCPYSGEPVNPDVTSEYKGQKVGFCCHGCKANWDKAANDKRDAMLAKAK